MHASLQEDLTSKHYPLLCNTGFGQTAAIGYSKRAPRLVSCLIRGTVLRREEIRSVEARTMPLKLETTHESCGARSNAPPGSSEEAAYLALSLRCAPSAWGLREHELTSASGATAVQVASSAHRQEQHACAASAALCFQWSALPLKHIPALNFLTIYGIGASWKHCRTLRFFPTLNFTPPRLI
ncbi:hypothetical protein DPSP01_010953 [Paraphaeosphaeria sporulosa]